MDAPVYCWPGTGVRGVHLHPFGYHGKWIQQAQEWAERLTAMGIRWVVVLSDGDAALQPQERLGGLSVVQWFLELGIVPIVRFQVHLNRPWPHADHVAELVRQFAPFGLTPLVLMGNEPGDPREYSDRIVPADWAPRYVAWFMKHGSEVVRQGAVALFADGPGWPYDPFPPMQPVWHLWEAGWMGYAGHWYGLNREPDWPYDSVTQTGLPLLTEQDLRDWYGPFYEDRGLNDVPLDVINRARQENAQPGLTAVQDPTCWRGWEQVCHWMETHFGRPLLMLETEGGWTPGAHAGTGGQRVRGAAALLAHPLAALSFEAGAYQAGALILRSSGRDLRYLKPTPLQVASWTLQGYESRSKVPGLKKFPGLCQCHWLLGDSVLGGAGGWDMDAWVTGWWRPYGYWLEAPVVELLRQAPANLWALLLAEVEELAEEVKRWQT